MTGHDTIHWKKHALTFAFWTGLALSYALSSGLTSISEGYPPNWLRALSWNLSNFWLWMALVPLVGWLGRQTSGTSAIHNQKLERFQLSARSQFGG